MNKLFPYLAAAREAFAQAAHNTGVTEHTLTVAGQQIELRFAGAALIPAILPALAHLRASDSAALTADVSFDLWDTASSGVPAPRPLFTAVEYHRYGQRALADDGRFIIMHAPTVPMLFAYDRETRHGFFWTADASQLSIYERASPLQTLFHWALREFGWQIVHAAAVGTERGGVLLIGGTGAGKSTTALSCLAQDGIKFLCDDKCLVRLEPEPQAFALFSSGKIKADMLERLPHFRHLLAGWDDSYKAGKGLVFLHPTYADHLITSFPVKALLIPSVAHQAQATLRPAAAASAFRLLGPSTVIWLPGAEADNYRFTADLVRRLPCYQLDLALEPERNTDAILNLLGRL